MEQDRPARHPQASPPEPRLAETAAAAITGTGVVSIEE